MTGLTNTDTIVLLRAALDDAFGREPSTQPLHAGQPSAVATRGSLRSRRRLILPVAAALIVVAGVIGLLAVMGPSQVERSTSTAPLDGFPPLHYEIDLPQAVPVAADELGTATRCATSFWQFDDGPSASSRSLSLCIRPGAAEAARPAGTAFEETALGPISQRQRTLQAPYVAREVFWIQGDDLWVLELVGRAHSTTSESVLELLGGLTMSENDDIQLEVDGLGSLGSGLTDPAGEAPTSTSTWEIGGTEVSMVLTADADAAGMANLRSHGPLMKYFTNGLGAFLVHSDDEQLTRVGWVVDGAGTWAELRVPDDTPVLAESIIEAIRAT